MFYQGKILLRSVSVSLFTSKSQNSFLYWFIIYKVNNLDMWIVNHSVSIVFEEWLKVIFSFYLDVGFRIDAIKVLSGLKLILKSKNLSKMIFSLSSTEFKDSSGLNWSGWLIWSFLCFFFSSFQTLQICISFSSDFLSRSGHFSLSLFKDDLPHSIRDRNLTDSSTTSLGKSYIFK